MRTAIELSEEQRAALLHLAAVRGLKGFSQLVHEALDHYLEQQSSRQRLIDAALEVHGALKGKPADDLSERVEELRSHWG